MKEIPHFSRFRSFAGILLLCFLNSCSTSSGIDDYYTFNVVKSQSIQVPSQVPVGQDVSGRFLITIDSADLITSKTLRTTIALTKSVKLTKLVFSSSDASYPVSSFDTLRLVVSADSLADELLATYSGATDAVSYTNADFAAYLKSPSGHFTVTFRAGKAPAQDVTISTNSTLVFSAKPVQ